MAQHIASGAILFAYALDSAGGGKHLDDDQIIDAVKSDTLSWVHLDATHADTAGWLPQAAPELDALIVSALLADETRPRFVQFGEGALIILRGVNLNPGAEPDDMVSTRLWVDRAGIISLQRRNLLAVSDLQEQLAMRTGPVNSGDFVARLIHALSDRIEPVLDELEQYADAVEARVFDTPDDSLRQMIVNVRQQAVTFRRFLSPQRDVTSAIRASDLNWLGPVQRRHLRETHDRLTRHVEELDVIRERTQIVQDELSNQLTARLNKNIFILSAISAIFIPLSFVTGLFGINVMGIPGAHSDNAFAIFSGLLIMVFLVQILIFKKLKWF